MQIRKPDWWIVGCCVVFLFVLHAMSSTRERISNVKGSQCSSRLPYVILLVAPLKLRLLHASSTTRTFVARDWIVAFGGLIVLISSSDYSRSRGRQLLQFDSRLAFSTSWYTKWHMGFWVFTQIVKVVDQFFGVFYQVLRGRETMIKW